MNRKRKEDETFEDYRDRQQNESKSLSRKLEGKLFHSSITYLKTYPFKIGHTYTKAKGANI